ncbi:uncharacterized protein LOC122404352 [Colletes gigas]|uniref:uncharacterized protein LOC122404352 n=1 Tax=Colletes gigas TaxID=935657 RepID=UPI001C9BBCC6|nr:uncharacterized protein LOC122404352 [Colletes gigas]
MNKNRTTRSKRPNKTTRRGGIKHRARLEYKRRIRELQEQLALGIPQASSHPGEPCYSPLSEASTLDLGHREPDVEVIDLTNDSDCESTVLVIQPPLSPIPFIDTNQAAKVHSHQEIPTEILSRYISELPNIQNNLIPTDIYNWCAQMQAVYNSHE